MNTFWKFQSQTLLEWNSRISSSTVCCTFPQFSNKNWTETFSIQCPSLLTRVTAGMSWMSNSCSELYVSCAYPCGGGSRCDFPGSWWIWPRQCPIAPRQLRKGPTHELQNNDGIRNKEKDGTNPHRSRLELCLTETFRSQFFPPRKNRLNPICVILSSTNCWVFNMFI